MPIIFRGTDCKLKEKLKTEIEPLFKNEAKAIIAISAILNTLGMVDGRVESNGVKAQKIFVDPAT